MRVLIVNSSWGWRRDEGREIEQLLLGLTATMPPDNHVFGTNGRQVFGVVSGEDGLQTVPLGGPRSLLKMPLDVAYVPMILPPLKQLAMAVLLSLRGVKIVCSTLGFLGRNFAAESWFGDRRLRDRLKPAKVAALRYAWRLSADHFVCASLDEVKQADLPVERCSLAAWPAPDSPLADAGRSRPSSKEIAGSSRSTTGPLALISRFDPYRKGFDRIERWLLAYGQSLPSPAVKVFAPLPSVSSGLEDASRIGLVEWDPDTRGEALASELQSCRGVVLLSRWEGQPRVLREAVLLGLPVLTTPAANFTEVIDFLGSGAVVDGDDPGEVQAAFAGLEANSSQLSRARLLFDRDRIGGFFWEVLTAVANDRPPPRSYYEAASRESER